MTSSAIRTRSYNDRQWVLPPVKNKDPDASCARRGEVIRVVTCDCAAAQAIAVYSCEQFGSCISTSMYKDILAEKGLHRAANCIDCPAYVRKQSAVDVAVICHNYEQYLDECLRSIERQTVKPRRVFIIDPLSDTPVAGAIRLETRCVWAAKRAAVENMTSPFGLIVDADNWLGPTFLEDSLASIGEASFAYPDKYHFGCSDRVERMADFDSSVTNMADTCSLFRVADWRIAQPAEGSPLVSEWEDHRIWRNIVKAGFKGVASGTKLHYRVHSGSMSANWNRNYYDNMGLARERVDVVVPLSGRVWAWAATRDWLLRQDNVRPVLLFTSGDTEFRRRVLSDMQDIDCVSATVRTGLEDRLADAPRIQVERQVQVAMCRIWSEAQKLVVNDYVMCLEDDILPQEGAVQSLLRKLDASVGCVAAPYLQRHAPHYTHWTGPFSFDNMAKEKGQGVQEITGSGFGCTLFRKRMLLAHPFTMPPGARYYDPAWFARNDTWRCLVDWDLEAQHRSA